MPRPRKNQAPEQPPPQQPEKSEPFSTRRSHRAKTTTTTTKGDGILPIASGGAEDPATLQTELAELKSRYQSGEAPTETRKEKQERKVYKTKADREAEAQRFEAFTGSLALVARVGAEMLCGAMPNPKPPTDLEVEVLDKSLSGVALKHFDKLLEYDAELSLLLVVLAIVLPRLKKEKPLKEVVAEEARNIFEASAAAEKKKEEDQPPDAAQGSIDSRPSGNGENPDKP